MTIEIVDLPSYKMVIFHSYVTLPEGIYIYMYRIYMHTYRTSTDMIIEDLLINANGFADWEPTKWSS